MGTYLNPSSFNFKRCLASQIYVDKSELISFTNNILGTEQGFVCVSRPRRFGKTMAADMLAAYYTKGENTDILFQSLKIKENPSYKKYLNQYNVIKVDMQSFLSKGETVDNMLNLLTEYLVSELQDAYPNVRLKNKNDLSEVQNNIYAEINTQFVILIDEWDCVMRYIPILEEQKKYLNYLRNWLKNQPSVVLAYMTGILPIKQYGKHSLLNMFYEYSMIQSYQLVPYFGFTENEVKALCEQFDMDFEEAKEWYDGYHFEKGTGTKKVTYSMYNPKSVVEAIFNDYFDAYWTQTETYEVLKEYIQKNYDGLKDATVEMLAGVPVKINTRHFQNDMNIFHDKDDVLTLLVHLGYLSYNQKEKTVSIPNKEVAQEFIYSIEEIDCYSIDKPAIIIELKWNKTAETAIDQIKRKDYPDALKAYHGNLLLCGINYDKDNKKQNKQHQCVIEQFEK